MKSRTLIFAASALFLLASCSGGSDDKKEKGESTGEVIDKYVTTLQTAPDKARKAVLILEKRGEAIDKSDEDLAP